MGCGWGVWGVVKGYRGSARVSDGCLMYLGLKRLGCVCLCDSARVGRGQCVCGNEHMIVDFLQL